jgi:hypothetical protein
MPSISVGRKRLLVLVVTVLGLAGATAPAGADVGKRDRQRLVVRADATAIDGPCDAVCRVALADGRFRGAPLGTGAYAGALELDVAHLFPNGEGGVCAPLEGRLVLGAGSPDRLVLAVSGDSCQDGAGPLPSAAFTGLARFVVVHGTGRYAATSGAGQATFSEDAGNRHRMTLVGRIAG